jgi:hypothetical protein
MLLGIENRKKLTKFREPVRSRQRQHLARAEEAVRTQHHWGQAVKPVQQSTRSVAAQVVQRTR